MESISQSKSRTDSALSKIKELERESTNIDSFIYKKSHEYLELPIVNRAWQLDFEIQDRRKRITELRKEEWPHLYNVNRRMNPIFHSLKGNTKLAIKYPTLSLAIYERIREADIVLVIAGMYDQYRSWMEFEFAIAADRHKPIEAVLPPQQHNLPRELQYYVTDPVEWNYPNIHHAVRAALE